MENVSKNVASELASLLEHEQDQGGEDAVNWLCPLTMLRYKDIGEPGAEVEEFELLHDGKIYLIKPTYVREATAKELDYYGVTEQEDE